MSKLFYYSTYEEIDAWFEGPFESPEAALASFREYAYNGEDILYIAELVETDFTKYAFIGSEKVIERYLEDVSDDGYYVETFAINSALIEYEDELEKELEEAMVRWMKRHGYDKERTLSCPVAYWVKTGEPCD